MKTPNKIPEGFENSEIPEDFENLLKYAPTLAGLKKETCFKIPEGYFESLSESIRLETMDFHERNSSSQDTSSRNASSQDTSFSGKKPEFKTPTDYFEKLPLAILDKIYGLQENKSSQNNTGKIINLDWFDKTKLLAVAASLVIICLISVTYKNTASISNANAVTADISSARGQNKHLEKIN